MRTRRLIEDRDRGCRYPGCPVTGFLENHHSQHWSQDGTTNTDSLISLCPRHHREHHQGEYTITGNPNRPDGLVFRSCNGWRIGAYPDATAQATTTQQPITAGAYHRPTSQHPHTKDIHFTHNHPQHE